MLTQQRFQRLRRAAEDGSLRGRHLTEALDALAEVRPSLAVKRGPKRVTISRVIDNIADLDEAAARSDTVRRLRGTAWEVSIEDADGENGDARGTGAVVRGENLQNRLHVEEVARRGGVDPVADHVSRHQNVRMDSATHIQNLHAEFVPEGADPCEFHEELHRNWA